MEFPNLKYTATERFLKYVTIDTQSDPNSPTIPSTEKQKNLGKVLVAELLDLGINDAHMDDYGYVYATVPSNVEHDVPVICFCSHMDTSPDCSGTDVKPIIHHNFDGSRIIFPLDDKQVITIAEHPALADQIGNDIITASGDTLLGADNKAGVAEIMDAVYQMVHNPTIKHGTVRILFTPDEEIGRGVDKVDMKKLNATFGYTMDGETVGHVEDENFNAKAAVIKITGVAAHPGFAKGKMENAIKIQQSILQALPIHTLSPETTDGKQPFVHPTSVKGNLEQAELTFILRSFTNEEMERLEDILEAICARINKNFPNSTIQLTITEQYRNMKEILDQHPEVVEYAVEAVKRAGVDPVRTSIRGGTDGSRLSFMGLPCPNIFAGEHAFHSKVEWVSIQDMERAVDTILHLVEIWAEKSKTN